MCLCEAFLRSILFSHSYLLLDAILAYQDEDILLFSLVFMLSIPFSFSFSHSCTHSLWADDEWAKTLCKYDVVPAINQLKMSQRNINKSICTDISLVGTWRVACWMRSMLSVIPPSQWISFTYYSHARRLRYCFASVRICTLLAYFILSHEQTMSYGCGYGETKMMMMEETISICVHLCNVQCIVCQWFR